jgi:hypothetical protein
MIWLPRADEPLFFSSPTSLSFGLLSRGSSRSLRVALTDAGGGAGDWRVSVRQLARSPGVSLRAPQLATVPGTLAVRAVVSGRAPARDGSGFLVLTRGASTRRIPYWLRVSVPRLRGERAVVLHRPGIYHGDTRGRPARVDSYRYPAAPMGLGIRGRLPGPEQVFRFVIRGRVANAGAVLLSGARVSPRLVRAGSEDRLAGYTALPLRVNTYQPGYFGLVPAVGVFRPAPGPYDLVFDTRSRRVSGRFTFRFWVNDTTPPSVGLLTPLASRGRLLVRVVDRGSGVDPTSLLALVDGRARQVVFAKGVAEVRLGALRAGRHRLVFSASDYQESKNNENASSTLPNTRRLAVTFRVR